MTSLKPYPSYRRTDLSWLGQIPTHWDIKRLKWTIEYCQNGAWGDEPNGIDDIACVRVADFDRTKFRVRLPIPTLRALRKEERRNKSLQKGDLLLEKSGGGDLQPVGFVVLYDSDEQAICSNFVARMPIREHYDSNFLCYLHASLYSGKINTQSIKQNTGIQNLDSVAYLNEKVPLPPFAEQLAIAAYLDRQNAKIDALIAKKRRLLDLLTEQRAAVISQAVTKGLNPDVEMEDSGVPWLGQVPSHWEVVHLRRVINKFVDYRGHTPQKVDNGIPLITARNIKNGRVNWELSQEYIPEELYDQWMVRGFPEIGDVLVTTEAPLGETAQVTDTRIALAQRIILLKANKTLITNDYLKYYFASMSGESELWSRATGSTAIGIKASHLKEILIIVPPVDEQIEITKCIEAEERKIFVLMFRVETAIERLREYRAALISSVVTGKVDVRSNK